MKKKIKLNKWYFRLGISPVYYRNDALFFEFGIFKIVKIPPEGEAFSKNKDCYKGFWMRKNFNIPDFFGIKF